LEIIPENDPKHDKKISLTSKLGVVMKYPNFRLIEGLKNLNEADTLVKIVAGCIDYIYDEDSIYYAKDTSEEELIDFIDSLTREQFNDIQDFFDTTPKMKKILDFKCSKCAYEDKIILEGIQSFFV
jgi:hypothetical protein